MSFSRAMREIDEAHGSDPRITKDGPYELWYAKRCTEYLNKLDPSPSELLQLAVRAQHFRRWEVPRDAYPMTKPGYMAWRSGLKRRQAELTREILLRCNYSEGDADRVAGLIRKDDMKRDEEAQTLEDVACLVFLDDGFELFRTQHEQDKIIHILKRTWPKMSTRGQQVAMGIDMSPEAAHVLQLALNS